VADKAVEKRDSTEVSRVDPAEEPSAEWGWHGEYPRTTRIGGVVAIIVMLLMLWFTRGHVWEARAWLWLSMAAVAVYLIVDYRKRKLSWRR